MKTQFLNQGIQVRIDSTGIVHSCPSMPEVEGKLVLFDDRHRFVTHDDMIIVSVEHLLGVLNEGFLKKMQKRLCGSFVYGCRKRIHQF